MTELTDEQKYLTEKLKILDPDINILWRKTGVASMVGGLLTIPISKHIDDSVYNFLKEYSAIFGIKSDLSDLKFVNKSYGYDTSHIKYQQIYQNIPVLHGITSIHINSDFKIVMIKNNHHPDIDLDTQAIIGGGITKDKAIDITHTGLNDSRLRKESTANLVIFPIEDRFYLTWEVNIALKNPLEGCLIYVDIRHGEIIKKRDVFKRKSNGKGRIFMPNPVVSLKNIKLTPENIPEEAYTTVTLKDLDGSGFLRGEYVDTENTPNRAYETSLLFYYKRGDSRFCEVMVYYHIDTCQRYIQELGFKNICDKQIKVNACADGVGSFFDSFTKAITYGSIITPDAEDGDIIIHEYAHAIMDDQVSSLDLTEQGSAIEQGFGDFLATCYFSEEGNGFNREAMGDWNGIDRELGCIRRVDNQKYYPEDFRGVLTSDSDGEIWSAALWDVYLTLGGNSKEKDNRLKARDRSIKLVLESNFFLTPLSEFIDAAEAIITANKHLYKGKDDEKIRGAFIKRGFF